MPRFHILIASVLAAVLLCLVSIITWRSFGNYPTLTFHPDQRPSVDYQVPPSNIPEGMLFVASRRGKYYYPSLSTRGQELSVLNRIYFQTEAQAQSAGFLHWK